MVKIIKNPVTKKVKLFKCPCGCKFTAETGDYKFCLSLNKELSYYTIACPFCDITYMYPYEKVSEIEIKVE